MVKRRGDSFQVDFRFQSQRIRRSFDNEVAAKTWEAVAHARLKAGLPLEEVKEETEAGWTLSKLSDACAARFWHGTSNEDDAVRNAGEVVALLGESRDPRSVTTRDVDDLVQKLKAKGNADATVNRKLAALSKMMRFALNRGIIDRTPTIERRKESQGRLRWYTPDEEASLLAACNAKTLEGKADDFRGLLIFLADTGARLGEAFSVTWTDVDDVYVRFHKTKNGRNRAVPLTERLRAVLRDRPRDETHVFAHWTKSTAHKAWQVVLKNSKVTGPDAVLHTFRHTCASRLVQAGTPIQVVQQWLGHATLSMTLRYSHLAPANILSAVQALEKNAPKVVKEKTA